MTQETDDLKHHIKGMKDKLRDRPNPTTGGVGYNTAVYILTDLFGCIFVGLAVGVFLQKVFDTSILLTATLTLLGGIAGLWTVSRYGMNLGKKQDKYREKHPEPKKPIPEKYDDED